ncbi:hypothetical protein RIF29_23933 [Crotalaria pallida]|uniref:Transmembrane protein n=1 Tax=Crotalaria pallida TaxID=3830 RepID=A0AAN9ENZ5_CROPI
MSCWCDNNEGNMREKNGHRFEGNDEAIEVGGERRRQINKLTQKGGWGFIPILLPYYYFINLLLLLFLLLLLLLHFNLLLCCCCCCWALAVATRSIPPSLSLYSSLPPSSGYPNFFICVRFEPSQSLALCACSTSSSQHIRGCN